MPSKQTKATDITFDRRRSDRPAAPQPKVDAPTGRASTKRATSDGRQPLVVYLRPESIRALKIAAVENDTTASAIVAEAVSSWLSARDKRKRS
jgi:antitoxin-like ribbon-helix-helix protein